MKRWIEDKPSQRLVILDYHGTLDRQADPIALVRALVQRGDVVVLWSGASSGIPRELKEAFTYIISKFSTLKEVAETVREQGHVINRIVVSFVDEGIC